MQPTRQTRQIISESLPQTSAAAPGHAPFRNQALPSDVPRTRTKAEPLRISPEDFEDDFEDDFDDDFFEDDDDEEAPAKSEDKEETTED